MVDPEVAMFGEGDAHEAVALWRAAGLTRPWNDPHADYRAALVGATSAVLGIRAEGGVVATVMAGYDGHRAWLYYLAVAAERRGQGLGRRLVAAAEEWLRGQGAPKVQVMVRAGNAAGGFYEALGYEAQDVAVMGRRLGEG